jgi:hypothetical protein
MKKLCVMIAAVAFVVAFTAPAFAAEWSFYGSARIGTFWADEDYGDFTVAGSNDDLDLTHDLQGNARIGANVKVSDNLVGRFEYGHTTSNVTTRMLYGEYDFGGFKLLVGQTYTPLNIFISNQVFGGDSDMLPYGGVYNGRRPMIRGKFSGFEIALVTPQLFGLSGYAIADTDVTLPLLEAKYSFKVAGLSLEVAGGYQTYKVVDATDNDEDVTSYTLAIGGTYNIGPFMIGGDYWMGRNVGNMNMWQAGVSTAAWDGVDKVLDNDGWGFLLVAAFTLSDMLRFEAGYGATSFDIDEADNKDETMAYYVQATINLAKGVSIVPEIGKIDYREDAFGNDEGRTTYYGLKWQINF